MSESVFLSPEPPAGTSHENVLGRRIVAALIDLVALSVVLAVFVALWGDTKTADGNAGFQLNGWPSVAFIGVALAYYLAFEVATGRTPGKALLGLEVRSGDGDRAGAGAIALRTILRVVDALPVFYVVGLVVAAVTKRNQRFGDLAAGTVVVRKAR